MKKYNFLYEDGDIIRFNGEILKIYLPKSNFEKKISEFNGNYITTMGIFLFEVTTFNNIEKNLSGEFHTLKLPVLITFQYNDYETFNGKLLKDLPEDDYNVFLLKKDDIFLNNKKIEKGIDNCSKFIELLHNGNIPPIIPYSEIINLYIQTLSLNGISLNNKSFIYELIISEVCRYSKDLKIPFRKVSNKEGIKETDYKNINIKDVPVLSSAYAGIAFEDIGRALVSSVNKTRNNEKQIESPIEKTIKY